MTEHQPPNQPYTSNRRTAERRTSATPTGQEVFLPLHRRADGSLSVQGYSVEFIPAERRLNQRRGKNKHAQ